MSLLASPLLTTVRRGTRYLRYLNAHKGEWLFPADRRFRAAAMELYQPFTPAGRVRRVLMSQGFAGSSVRLDSSSLQTLERAFAGTLSRDNVRLAFYTTMAGSLSKTSIIISDPSGQALAFAKAARSSEARNALARERKNLIQLGEYNTSSSLWPRPLAWLTHEGHRLLVTTLAPKLAGPIEFGRVHEAFLKELRRASGIHELFGNSMLWERACVDIQELSRSSDGAWTERFARVADTLRARLTSVPMRLTLAHRDFAPWNTRVGAAGLYVFDWEHGDNRYPWSHDAFHFRFMTSLLLEREMSVATITRWLDEQRRQHFEVDPSLLLLSYLLDVGLQYHGFNQGSKHYPNDPVLKAVSTLLDASPKWLR